jgi:hypothetical protein
MEQSADETPPTHKNSSLPKPILVSPGMNQALEKDKLLEKLKYQEKLKEMSKAD